MSGRGPIAVWYPGLSRRFGHDVRLLGYNTDRKVHVRRLDTGRDFYVHAHELGMVRGGLAALNEAFARLPYIPRKGGRDPGPPHLGGLPAAPLAGGAFAEPDDDMLIDGGLR